MIVKLCTYNNIISMNGKVFVHVLSYEKGVRDLSGIQLIPAILKMYIKRLELIIW